jgi:hypothetical protein
MTVFLIPNKVLTHVYIGTCVQIPSSLPPRRKENDLEIKTMTDFDGFFFFCSQPVLSVMEHLSLTPI